MVTKNTEYTISRLNLRDIISKHHVAKIKKKLSTIKTVVIYSALKTSFWILYLCTTVIKLTYCYTTTL